ncbi:MAG: hypothetical protein P1U57_11470 [Oleibacter sp.]|nr:hypothetical protein [Thalassolituus sp.]
MRLKSHLVATSFLLASVDTWAAASSYFSASYSTRQNDVITVLADTEVEYEDSKYTRFEFSQKLYKDFRLGAVLQLDEEAQDILGYTAKISSDRWLVSIEQSEFNGQMVNDQGVAFADFDGNSYLDLKFLKKIEKPLDEVEKSVSFGLQYLTYQRPAAFEQDGVEYYDTELENHFLAFVFEIDSVKDKMINGGIESSFDWYFYNTTALGVGMLESSNPKLRNNPGVDGNPDQTTWVGLGIAGEYELGLVWFYDAPKFRFAAKAGYRADLEGPVSFHGGSFDISDDTVHPDEQLLNHGPNLTLSAAF